MTEPFIHGFSDLKLPELAPLRDGKREDEDE
jgi:hypothetical protein